MGGATRTKDGRGCTHRSALYRSAPAGQDERRRPHRRRGARERAGSLLRGVDTELRPASISYKTTALLPKDVALRRCVAVSDEFDARRDARSRTYEYRVVNDEIRSPLERHHAGYAPQRLDPDLLCTAARLVEGTHDFRAFTPQKSYHVRFETSRYRLALELGRRPAKVSHNCRLVPVRYGPHPGRHHARGCRRKEGSGGVRPAALGRKTQ